MNIKITVSAKSVLWKMLLNNLISSNKKKHFTIHNPKKSMFLTYNSLTSEPFKYWV
jgi:hypothetical protein